MARRALGWLKKRLPERELNKYFINSVRPHLIPLPKTIGAIEAYGKIMRDAEREARKMSLLRHPAERARRLRAIRKAVKVNNRLVGTVSSLDFYYNASKRKKTTLTKEEIREGLNRHTADLERELEQLKALIKKIRQF